MTDQPAPPRPDPGSDPIPDLAPEPGRFWRHPDGTLSAEPPPRADTGADTETKPARKPRGAHVTET